MELLIAGIVKRRDGTLRHVIIAGAGACGLFAAIHCARAGAKVTVIEKNEKPGRKLLMTGNGKCNLTNSCQNKEDYHSHNIDKAWKILQAFSYEDTIKFFQEEGMMIMEHRNYCYPYSAQAASVQELLIRLAKKEQVKFITKAQVKSISVGAPFHVTILKNQQKQILACDRLIVATGGYAAPKTGSTGDGYYLAGQQGHHIVSTAPALCGLHVKRKHKSFPSGVRFDVAVTLQIDNIKITTEKGQLQFTDYGVSGIVIFQLSRHVAYGLQNKQKVTLTIDLLPDYNDRQWKEIASKYRTLELTMEELCHGIFPKKLTDYLLERLKLHREQKTALVEDGKFAEFITICKELPMEIEDTNTYEQAQVTAGGIDLEEVDDHLQSKLAEGLYFAGEVLDVDGKCGGYNLQWAWSSGYTAGTHAATS